MDSADAPRGGDADPSGLEMTDGEASIRDGRRPGWAGLLWAGVVVLVVGGFALSRSYGVHTVSAPPDPEEVADPSTSSTTSPAVSVTAANQHASVGSVSIDWMYAVSDMDVSPDGLVYVASLGAGVASLDGEGEWTLLDIEGLPEGTGLESGYGVRVIRQITIGPDGTVWLAGSAMSHVDDEEFGGYIGRWTGGRTLEWIAFHCPMCGEWTVWTTNEVPDLAGNIFDLAVSPDGMVYAVVGDHLLIVFDGDEWTSHEVPIPSGDSGVLYPWSGSLAVGDDGVVWAGTWEDGLFAFDPVSGYTRYTTEDGLPSDNAFQVAAGTDRTIWVATDVLYADPLTASPDEAAGVAAFDGATWTTYTMADGLLSNQAVIAAGADGTVWAVHYEIPPYGYSRFDGTEWTAYPFDPPVGGYRAEVAADGTLWTVSDEGLVSFDGTTRTIHPSPFIQPEGSFTFTPVQWGINLDDLGPGAHTIFMVVDARPLTREDVEDLSGRLIWDETIVDLCRIGIRNLEDGFLHIGDIFQTTEGCGANPTAMQDAFDEFGLPETACVTVTFGGLGHEYCAPLR